MAPGAWHQFDRFGHLPGRDRKVPGLRDWARPILAVGPLDVVCVPAQLRLRPGPAWALRWLETRRRAARGWWRERGRAVLRRQARGIGAIPGPVHVTSWRAVNLLFLVTTTLESLAMGHLTAFTPLFLGELGLPDDDVGLWTGLLFAAMMAIAFPLAPFWGALAERYSRRLIIVRSQYLEAVGYATMALAPDIWWLLGSRLVLGLTFGNIAVIIATQTLILRAAMSERRLQPCRSPRRSPRASARRSEPP